MRLAFLATLCLTLAACDSGAAPDVLVGTWDFESARSVTYVTVSQAQSARDPNRPGDGGVTVTGAQTGSFRYFLGPTTAPQTGAIVREGLSSLEHAGANRSLQFNGTQPTAIQFVVVTDDRRQSFRHRLGAGPDEFTLTDTYLEVRPVELVDPFTNEVVTVSGRLTFARASVPANQETALSPLVQGADDVTVRRVTFGPSGTYSEVNVYSEGTRTTTGTWNDLGDGWVRVVFPGGGGKTYRYAVDGSALTLSEDREVCATDCDGSGQRNYGFLPGTTTALRNEHNVTFRLVPAEGRP